MNNYFADGLKALEANIHIQPVFNHYKALDYIRVYLSKSEDESSEAMKETVEEAVTKKVFPGVVFANANLPGKRFRICLKKDEMAEL